MKKEDIKKALSNIKSEVKELHPHLNKLFNMMDNIVNVDYTHGPNENGADFVLKQKDDVLHGAKYVAVVVKNGGVTNVGIDSILRQIREGKKRRVLENGKKKLAVDEIWVVVNGNFTKNAKEMVYHENPLGVRCFDINDIATWMEEYKYPIDGEISPGISMCLSNQIAYVDKLKSQSMAIVNAQDLYIERKLVQIDLQYKEGKKPAKRKDDAVWATQVAKNNNVIYIYGEPGSGKSDILYELVKFFAESKQYKHFNAIPLYVSARDVVENHNCSLLEFIGAYEKQNHIEEEKNFYVLIIDDVDTCADTRSERLDIIKQWKDEFFSDQVKKVVFASREFVSKDDLGVNAVYRVNPLSFNEIVTIIRNQLRELNAVERIIDDLKRSHVFNSLPKHPTALTILISLLKSIKHPELPSTLPELYAKYAEVSLGRWEQGVSESERQVKYHAARAILSNIAGYMVKNDLSKLNEKEAKRFFSNYLNERNLGIDADPFFAEITEKTDVFFIDNGLFQFRHRTICEFFNARLLNGEIISQQGEDVFSHKMINSLYFYVGSQKDCPDLLEKISAITPTHDVSMLVKLINMSNILLAGYATPYTYIEAALEQTIIEVSIYINDVIEGKTPDSVFNNISTMHLLHFIRTIVGYEYSYLFFKRAVENALIRIEDNSSISDDIKASALFFTNVMYKHLGEDDIFTSMISKKSFELPDHIKLAVDHETDYMEKVSSDIKKYKRTIERGLRKNRNIRYLYHKKIADIRKNEDEKE